MKNQQELQKKDEMFNIASLDPKQLKEFRGYYEKQNELVKTNLFVEIIDSRSYSEAKKCRLNLKRGRTDLDKQDKEISKQLNALRTNCSIIKDELIEITFPYETKQDREIKRYEAILDKEKKEKQEQEALRVQSHKNRLEEIKIAYEGQIDNLTYDGLKTFEFDKIIYQEDPASFEEFEDDFMTLISAIKEKLKFKSDQLIFEKEKLESIKELQAERAEFEEKIKEFLEEKSVNEIKEEKSVTEPVPNEDDELITLQVPVKQKLEEIIVKDVENVEDHNDNIITNGFISLQEELYQLKTDIQSCRLAHKSYNNPEVAQAWLEFSTEVNTIVDKYFNQF
jgi:hypothetical protein